MTSICNFLLEKPFIFSSLILFLGRVPRASELWADISLVCYTCVHCVYSATSSAYFAGCTVYCDSSTSCPWSEASGYDQFHGCTLRLE